MSFIVLNLERSPIVFVDPVDDITNYPGRVFVLDLSAERSSSFRVRPWLFMKSIV